MKKERMIYLTALFVTAAVSFALAFAFLSANADDTPEDARLDLNGDGVVNIKDVSYLLEHLSGEDPVRPSTPEEILNAAYALGRNESLEGTYTLTGKVTKIEEAYSRQTGYVTLSIAVEGFEDFPVLCYRLTDGDGIEAGKGVEAVKIRDVVTVSGRLVNSGGAVEFDRGCTLDALEPAKRPETPGEIFEAAAGLSAGEALEGTYTLTGTVVSIDTEYVFYRKYITVTIRINGKEDYEIQCYHLRNGSGIRTNEGVEIVEVGSTVTVNGVIERSSTGGLRFASGCTLEYLRSPGGDLQKPGEIVSAAYALPDGYTLGQEFALSGKVSEITEAYTAENGLSFRMIVGELTDLPIDCRGIKGEAASAVKVGDAVIVSGILTKAGSAVTFAEGAALTLPSAANADENASYETIDGLGDRLGLTYGIPSTGDVEILVIPIGFTNSNYPNVRETLEKGFNGTPEDTGWHSLTSYYNEVSYGALNIHATITDVYQTGARYDLRKGKSETEDYKYLVDALKYFDATYDYSEFDQNGDGYIDCMYLVYLAPYMTDYNQSDLWWAYTYEFFEENTAETRLDGTGIDWYMWFSFEFFSHEIYENGRESSTLGVTVNAETVIHETGHALGLDDYYDYVSDGADYGGLGGLNMMDCNQGDHDPFSKAILGWIEPTVLKSGSFETTLSSYTATGNAIFLAKNGNGTYFDEFYVIIYYTPDGVNALKAPYGTGLYDQPGVVVYHVDATLKNGTLEGILDIYAHNNSEASDRLIRIVEADGRNDIDNNYWTDSDDLFKTGDSLMLRWYDGSLAGWTVTVGAIGENGVEISIVG